MGMHFSSSASIFATRTVINNYIHDKSVNDYIYEISEKCNNAHHIFPEPKIMSLNYFFVHPIHSAKPQDSSFIINN